MAKKKITTHVCEECLEDFPATEVNFVPKRSIMGDLVYSIVMCDECVKNNNIKEEDVRPYGTRKKKK